MIEGGKFITLQKIHPGPVKENTSEINHQPKRQKFILVALPEVFIKITDIRTQQTDGNCINSQNHKLSEIQPLSEIMVGKHMIIVIDF